MILHMENSLIVLIYKSVSVSFNRNNKFVHVTQDQIVFKVFCPLGKVRSTDHKGGNQSTKRS